MEFVFLGIVLALGGLSMVFMKDFHWNLYEWSQRNAGLKPERTPQWESAQTVGGVLIICFGLFFIIASLISGG